MTCRRMNYRRTDLDGKKFNWTQPEASSANGELKSSKPYTIIYYTEMVIRALRIFHPNLAIMYLAAGWRCASFPPYFCSAAKSHLEVTEYYNVDHVSIINAVMPLVYQLEIQKMDPSKAID